MADTHVTPLIAVLLALALGSGQAACPPAGHDAASLQALKAAGWQLPEPAAAANRGALALALLDCLADADPRLRDELAFEGLQAWMRARLLDEATLRAIRQRLLAMLAAPADADGFAQPFAALALAEVTRVDRLHGFLSAAERRQQFDAAVVYLAGVRDTRAFDPQAGWRHGVAHGADGLLQWALHPALDRPMADAMLVAIAAQLLPAGNTGWTHGEPERLMAPVFFLARRPLLAAADWQAWFDSLMARRRPARPATATSLAERHHLGQFLHALYVSAAESSDAEMRDRLMPGLRTALRQLD